MRGCQELPRTRPSLTKEEKAAAIASAAERQLLEHGYEALSIAARKPSRSQGTIERILWFTDQFAALSELRGAMTERARSSEVVAAFVAELDALLSRMLSNAFRDYIPEGELDIAVDSFRATVEGTFAKGLDRRKRRRVLTFALERLIGHN